MRSLLMWIAVLSCVLSLPLPVVAASAKKAPAPVELNYRGIAHEELQLTAKERSAGVLSTPATVRPRVVAFESPVTYTAMQVGVSLTSYRPEGRSRVSSLQPYELGSLGERPLPSLELRWQPYELDAIPNLYFGGYAMLGYTVHDVKLRAPTGNALPDTKLHTVKSGAGVATTYRFGAASRWSVANLLGIGHLNSVQASRSNFANASTGLPYASASFLAQARFAKTWTGYAGYEYRRPLRPEREELKLQDHQAVVGLLGSLR